MGTAPVHRGLAALALAMNGAVAARRPTCSSTGSTVAVVVVAVVALFAWLWFGLGLVRRAQAGAH